MSLRTTSLMVLALASPVAAQQGNITIRAGGGSSASVIVPQQGTPVAQDDARQAQVQAAASNAAASLREQVMRMPLSRDSAVRDLIHRMGSDGSLTQALQNAQQIGGPRWVDDHTCQVRLEVPGADLAAVIIKDVEEHPDQSPLPPDAL